MRMPAPVTSAPFKLPPSSRRSTSMRSWKPSIASWWSGRGGPRRGPRLAPCGREVIVLEAAEGIGTETSSRNSEVIHAAFYYPKDSLMARTCVEGRRKLYAYCAEHGVPHRNCGQADRRHQCSRERDAAVDQGGAPRPTVSKACSS